MRFLNLIWKEGKYRCSKNRMSREMDSFVFCAFSHASISMPPLHTNSVINIHHYAALNLQLKWIGQQRPKTYTPCTVLRYLFQLYTRGKSSGVTKRKGFKGEDPKECLERLYGFDMVDAAGQISEQNMSRSQFFYCARLRNLLCKVQIMFVTNLYLH